MSATKRRLSTILTAVTSPSSFLQYYRATVKVGRPFDRTAFDKVTRRSVGRADIQELDDIHTALDQAVLDAYGWPPDLSDEQILERLLALNLARAAGQT